MYKIYLQKFIDTNPLIEGDIRPGIINSIENLKNYKHHKTANCKMNPKETINFLENINFHGLQDKSDKFLTNQAKYFCNFMKVFELLLLFTRPTRQQLCELHLSTSHELVKYLFADDMCNYARMTPAYLSQMYEYEMKDSETWEFFMNGYFSVNKTSVPFTAIGADHAIEHENRPMKVLGGIKGIANDISKLDKYFTIAPEINQIIQIFFYFRYRRLQRQKR